MTDKPRIYPSISMVHDDGRVMTLMITEDAITMAAYREVRDGEIEEVGHAHGTFDEWWVSIDEAPLEDE